MFNKTKHNFRWLAAMGFLVVVCAFALSPSSAPTVLAAGSFAYEFNGPDWDPALTAYIPSSGANISLTVDPGYLRMILPAYKRFDHWASVDNAPQLRVVAPSGDWELATRLRVLTPTGPANYHAGLMVFFSKQDLLYWGPYQGREIRLERSGLRPGVSAETPLARAGSEVELQIVKQGTNYAFSYRAAGTNPWKLVGNYTASETPQFVGLITKTWSNFHMDVNFDYLHIKNL